MFYLFIFCIVGFDPIDIDIQNTMINKSSSLDFFNPHLKNDKYLYISVIWVIVTDYPTHTFIFIIVSHYFIHLLHKFL